MNGLSNNHVWTATPDSAGLADVDLMLQFSLTNFVNSLGLIEITIPLAWKLVGNDIKDYCWSDIQYSSCTYSSGTLQLAITENIGSGETIQIYLDQAVDMAGTAGVSTDGFRITTSWAGITIDQDDASVITSRKFTTAASLSENITPANTNSISNYPKNAGDSATYSFTFKSSKDFSATDKIKIVFPMEYDPFIGDSWIKFENEPSNYYIDCLCPQLGTVLCQVEHWEVIVRGTSEPSANTDITITIYEVFNPPYNALGTGAF